MSDSTLAAKEPQQRHRLRSLLLYWLTWIIWLPFLVPGLLQLLRPPRPLPSYFAQLVSLAAFVALYLGATYVAARELSALEGNQYWKGSKAKWAVVAALAALAVAVAALRQQSGVSLMAPFIYTAAYVGGVFRARRAIVVNAALVALCSATAGIAGLEAVDLVQVVFLISVVTFMTVIFVRSIIANRELIAAQNEIARLAVANERLRIARDLHDLLGHKLSLIGLKSDLARRVMKSDPERAMEEIAVIGREARLTLQEVRDAVSRYRTSTVEGELRAAKEILSASAVGCQIDCDRNALATLPAPVEQALAWAVREGVTNVVRHSSAKSCRVRVFREEQFVRVEILDDGCGAGAGAAEGSGLRGLRDRLSAVGGRCETRSLAEGGFALTATVAVSPASGRAAR